MGQKKIYIALSIVLLSAFFMRLYPITAGLPYAFWHDEKNYVETALRFGTGNFKPATFSHGGFFQLILFIIYGICYLILRLVHTIQTPADFLIQYLKDPSLFFILGRLVVVLCGTAIAYLSFLIGARAFNVKTGLTAAIFTAFSFLMVQISSVALADIPAVFILLSAFLLLVFSMERSKDNILYYAACFLTGLAAACKYYTVFGVIPICIAAFFRHGRDKRPIFSIARSIFIGILLTAAGFLIGIPSLIFNPQLFYKDTFIRLGGEYILQDPNKNIWLYYFTHHLRNGLGAPLELLVLGGIVYSFYKRSKWQMFLLSFPAAYYLLLMNSTGFAHHMLPAVPFLLILAAYFLTDLIDRYKVRYSFSILIVLSLAVVIPTFSDSIKFINIIKSRDTRIIAKDWIENNIANEESIMAEGYVNRSASHCPALNENSVTLQRDIDYIISSGGNGLLLKTKMANIDRIYASGRRYNIFKTNTLNKDDLSGLDPSYIVLTGNNDMEASGELEYYLSKDRFVKRISLKEYLRGNYILISSFYPNDEYALYFPVLTNNDYRLIRHVAWKDLARYVAGPRIEVYKKKL